MTYQPTFFHKPDDSFTDEDYASMFDELASQIPEDSKSLIFTDAFSAGANQSATYQLSKDALKIISTRSDKHKDIWNINKSSKDITLNNQHVDHSFDNQLLALLNNFEKAAESDKLHIYKEPARPSNEAAEFLNDVSPVRSSIKQLDPLDLEKISGGNGVTGVDPYNPSIQRQPTSNSMLSVGSTSKSERNQPLLSVQEKDRIESDIKQDTGATAIEEMILTPTQKKDFFSCIARLFKKLFSFLFRPRTREPEAPPAVSFGSDASVPVLDTIDAIVASGDRPTVTDFFTDPANGDFSVPPLEEHTDRFLNALKNDIATNNGDQFFTYINHNLDAARRLFSNKQDQLDVFHLLLMKLKSGALEEGPIKKLFSQHTLNLTSGETANICSKVYGNAAFALDQTHPAHNLYMFISATTPSISVKGTGASSQTSADDSSAHIELESQAPPAVGFGSDASVPVLDTIDAIVAAGDRPTVTNFFTDPAKGDFSVPPLEEHTDRFLNALKNDIATNNGAQFFTYINHNLDAARRLFSNKQDQLDVFHLLLMKLKSGALEEAPIKKLFYQQILNLTCGETTNICSKVYGNTTYALNQTHPAHNLYMFIIDGDEPAMEKTKVLHEAGILSQTNSAQHVALFDDFAQRCFIGQTLDDQIETLNYLSSNNLVTFAQLHQIFILININFSEQLQDKGEIFLNKLQQASESGVNDIGNPLFSSFLIPNIAKGVPSEDPSWEMTANDSTQTVSTWNAIVAHNPNINGPLATNLGFCELFETSSEESTPMLSEETKLVFEFFMTMASKLPQEIGFDLSLAESLALISPQRLSSRAGIQELITIFTERCEASPNPVDEALLDSLRDFNRRVDLSGIEGPLDNPDFSAMAPLTPPPPPAETGPILSKTSGPLDLSVLDTEPSAIERAKILVENLVLTQENAVDHVKAFDDYATTYLMADSLEEQLDVLNYLTEKNVLTFSMADTIFEAMQTTFKDELTALADTFLQTDPSKITGKRYPLYMSYYFPGVMHANSGNGTDPADILASQDKALLGLAVLQGHSKSNPLLKNCPPLNSDSTPFLQLYFSTKFYAGPSELAGEDHDLLAAIRSPQELTSTEGLETIKARLTNDIGIASAKERASRTSAQAELDGLPAGTAAASPASDLSIQHTSAGKDALRYQSRMQSANQLMNVIDVLGQKTKRLQGPNDGEAPGLSTTDYTNHPV